MSNFFDDLLTRNLGEAATILPRLPARFETPAAPPLVQDAEEEPNALEWPRQSRSQPSLPPTSQQDRLIPPEQQRTSPPPPAAQSIQPAHLRRATPQSDEDTPPAVLPLPRPPKQVADTPVDVSHKHHTPTERASTPRVDQDQPAPAIPSQRRDSPPAIEPQPTPALEVASPQISHQARSTALPMDIAAPVPYVVSSPPLSTDTSAPISKSAPTPTSSITVRVHIGRIEVHAPRPEPQTSAPRPPAPRPATPLRPARSLDDYLQRKGR